MKKEQAKQLFDMYNPVIKVSRCPNGRASFRKILDVYARAAVNLYGTISMEDFAEIFNNQNSEQTNTDEVFTLLLPVILKKKKYCFYKGHIVHYLAIDNFDFGDFWRSEQEGKPRYIPGSKEFLKYEDDYYSDEKQELLWSKAFEFILDEWLGAGDIYGFYNEIKERSQITGQYVMNDLLRKYDLVFSAEKQIQPFFDLVTNAHNNTRMWTNKGHTPNELMEIRKTLHQKNGRQQIIVHEHRKIGANELCPCGSGKKYKKCCGLTGVSKTAQLHWSECTLFYETWYGLMDFVNAKKKIINVQIKPVYPNSVSDELIYKVREVLWKNPELIDDYLSSVNLREEKTTLLKSWKNHHIKGPFLIMEYKPDYALLISADEKQGERLYGVTGISRSLAEALQRELPVQVDTVLLPFKNKIIYDSYLSTLDISFGSGIKKMFSDSFKNAMKNGIITCLPS